MVVVEFKPGGEALWLPLKFQVLLILVIGLLQVCSRNETINWAYSTWKAITGTDGLGYIDVSVVEPPIDDFMLQIEIWKHVGIELDSPFYEGEIVVTRFSYCKTVKELWNYCYCICTLKRINARILWLTNEVSHFK